MCQNKISIQFSKTYNINQMQEKQGISGPSSVSSFTSILNYSSTAKDQTPEQRKSESDHATLEKTEVKSIWRLIDVPMLKIQTPSQQETCNCRKSMCLKMYCECFSKGKMCNESCLCDGCKNRTDNSVRSEAINKIITKDPFAFSRKDINSETISEACNCRKSKCLKKYCECFRMGRKCNPMCKCIDCENYDHIEGEKPPMKKVKIG